MHYDRRLSLPSLKCLHLYQCSISRIDPLFYSSVPNLLQLNLNNNDLQAIDGIGNLKKLMSRVVYTARNPYRNENTLCIGKKSADHPGRLNNLIKYNLIQSFFLFKQGRPVKLSKLKRWSIPYGPYDFVRIEIPLHKSITV